ncbi:HSP20-like chaperone [Auricularia subglabra TFB-10046 SS5]|nr:HSP20-like chaperone [Auricularia subglabra TFB-10046 SS5]
MSLIWSSFPFDGAFADSDSSARRSDGEHHTSHVSRTFRPRMDVHENKDTNTVTATFELPGLKKEDVLLDVHQGRLTVSGRVAETSKEHARGYVVRERRAGKFMRQFVLPAGVKPEDVKTSLSDGVLTVTWPKSTPELQAKRIAIN